MKSRVSPRGGRKSNVEQPEKFNNYYHIKLFVLDVLNVLTFRSKIQHFSDHPQNISDIASKFE